MSGFSLPGRDDLLLTRLETALSSRERILEFEALKKGAHGGNMVSAVAKRPDWVGIPVAGIERLMEQATQTL